MTTRPEYHNATARDFLARARTCLAEDDLLQASEKGWGAAAQAVKAVAQSRGWQHRGHKQFYATIDRLVKETGDMDLGSAFNDAGALHVNFYEGWLSRQSVERNLSRVGDLVERLEPFTL